MVPTAAAVKNCVVGGVFSGAAWSSHEGRAPVETPQIVKFKATGIFNTGKIGILLVWDIWSDLTTQTLLSKKFEKIVELHVETVLTLTVTHSP